MHDPVGTQEFGRVRQAVLLGLFAGTGVGLGYLLAAVPGVELMSTNAALAGAALGPLGGAAVGMIAQGVYSLASPFGPPVPLMLVAQLVGMAVAGLLGAMAGRLVRARGARPVLASMAGLLGAVAAIQLDLLTNVAVAVQFALPWQSVLVGGLAVAALHLATVSVAWAVLFPVLGARLFRLRRPGPRALVVGLMMLAPLARGQDAPPDSLTLAVPDSLPVPAAADSLATAAPDSLPVARPDSLAAPASPSPRAVAGPPLPEGWTRPFWQPFHGTLLERLQRTSSWLPVRDGGQGSAMVILGEPATDHAPAIWRDGIPLGVGNRRLDDLESWSLAGRDLRSRGGGAGLGGAMGGILELVGRDPSPDSDLLDTYWFAGPHETRLRDVQFLTADARWRLAFDVYEQLDREGYDFRVPDEMRYTALDDEPVSDFWGNAAVRSGRGRLIRRLDDGARVSLSYETTRKHKHGMAIDDLSQQEIWRSSAQIRWQEGPAAGRSQASLWWTDTDLLLRPADAESRLIEGVREGVRAVWAPRGALVDLDVVYQRWSLRDGGSGAAWFPADADTNRVVGEDVSLSASRRLGWAWPLNATANLWWAEHGGLAGGGKLTAGGDTGLRAELARGGRAPRSDEVATPWRHVVPSGRQTVILPNRDLERERTWRAALGWSGRALGWDLGLDAAWRQLRHGIGWEPLEDDSTSGLLTNGVALTSTSATARVGRAGRFLGWIRVQAEVTRHHWTQEDTRRIALPPELQFRLSAVWEHRYFQEDGIVQLAAYYHNRGEMADPWALSRREAVAGRGVLDVIAGFRLVGTNISLEFRNLLGAESPLSASALSSPREFRWRLHWTFQH